VRHPVTATPELGSLADLLRERSKSLEEMAGRAAFLVIENMAYDEKAATKHLKPAAEPILEDLHDRLVALEPWNAASIAPIFEAVREAQGGIGMGKLAQPVRVAVTGSSASPGIYETLEVLGKKKSVSRIAEAIHFIRHG
jgi:glutamyl-tRNA synthetase